MAAPTVGAVMADILPYLQVERCDSSGQMVVVENLQGLSAKEAQTRLEALGFTAEFVGQEESVTDQIPAAGISIPFGSQVLLYMGENSGKEPVAVPDFFGMTRQQASDAAGMLGLYIQIAGNTGLESHITVTAQSIEKNTPVPPGTTIRLEFTDSGARD